MQSVPRVIRSCNKVDRPKKTIDFWETEVGAGCYKRGARKWKGYIYMMSGEYVRKLGGGIDDYGTTASCKIRYILNLNSRLPTLTIPINEEKAIEQGESGVKTAHREQSVLQVTPS